MKIRPVGASTFDRAMKMVAEVNSFEELLTFLKKHFPHWNPDTELLSIKHLSGDGDAQEISINGKVVLLGDGQFDPRPKQDGDPEQRAYALELMGHPLNLQFFRGVVHRLKDDGKYFWPGMMMEFTRAEIQQALEDAEKGEN